MSIRACAVAALFFAAIIPAVPALAASDMETCTGETTPIERIGACTRVIDGGASGKDLVSASTARGIAYGRLGQMDTAISDFTTALDNDKARSELWIARARAYFNKTEYDLAMLDLAEAIKLEPKNSIPRNLMGKNHFMLGNYELALKFFDEAVELDPNHYNAFVNRATTYYRTNDLANAMKDVNAAYLMLPPGDSRGRELLQLKVAIERAFASQQSAAPASN